MSRLTNLCSKCGASGHNIRTCSIDAPPLTKQQLSGRLAERRMADGMCRQCGKIERVQGGSTCLACRVRMRESARKRREVLKAASGRPGASESVS